MQGSSEREDLTAVRYDPTIFIRPGTIAEKYRYKINIHHPVIRPLYETYKKKLGENILSDRQRWAFENMIISRLRPVQNSEKDKGE